ncbi:MAG: hypothetical protein PVH25_13665 [Burkholderiales bacterium]|jgi:hypothetical protein
MKLIPCFVALFALLFAGCTMLGAPAPKTTSMADLPQKHIDALVDCETKYPQQIQRFYPSTGYFSWEGKDAENVRECLKSNYGWIELGPPNWKEGTTSPPH